MTNHTDNRIAEVFSREVWVSVGRRRWLAVLNLLLAVSAASMFVGYLCLNNQTAAHGFAIRDLERKIDELQDEKRRLDLEVLSRRSMDNVEARVRDLGFVPIGGVDYLFTGRSGVALK